MENSLNITMKCFRYVRLNVIYFTFRNVLRWLTRKFKITYMVVTVALSAGFSATLQGFVHPADPS